MNDPTRPILLVEDNAMDIDLTRRAFVKCKVANQLIIARDGEEALAHVERWEAGAPAPVLILLDLKLPKVDGLEVLRRIKGHPELRTIPVVVLTCSADDCDVRTAYELGVNSYIVKPVDFEKFVQTAGQINLYWLLLNTPPR